MILLAILDGFGCSRETRGNAIKNAHTPNFDRLFREYPYTTLKASGSAVGLPEGQMGNSEVGHLNLGAGRVVLQELPRIDLAIQDGSFYRNPVLLEALENVKRSGSSLHLMGLVSDGGVHSHINHLHALLEMARFNGVNDVCVHAFLDGRDTPPKSGLGFIRELERRCEIATVSGRYYAMDRDRRWERTRLAYDALTLAAGRKCGSAVEAVETAYRLGETDEFVKPTVVTGRTIRSGDSVVFFNFRADRARQLTRAFTDLDFPYFPRQVHPRVHFVCMTQYDRKINAGVAFPPHRIKNTLGEVLSQQGLRQLRIAETEKYAHVTFFFNGGVEEANPGEDRVLIPSPKVATYDLKPEMSAPLVTSRLLEIMENYDVVILNFANLDMVGHTGVYAAAVKAVETVDACIGRIHRKLEEIGGVMFLTGDHGNAEQMYDNSTPHTAHTGNPVPFLVTVGGVELRGDGILADVAPTMLELLGLEKPVEMTGESLIKK